MRPIRKIIEYFKAFSKIKKLEEKHGKEKREWEDERIRRIKTAGGGKTITEFTMLYLMMECPKCKNELFGTFIRDEGFNFTCIKCGTKIVGAISGFTEKAKKIFRKIIRRKYYEFEAIALDKKETQRLKDNTCTVVIPKVLIPNERYLIKIEIRDAII